MKKTKYLANNCFNEEMINMWLVKNPIILWSFLKMPSGMNNWTKSIKCISPWDDCKV